MPDVSSAQLLQLLRGEGLSVLDTRSPGEYSQGHIIGAESLPLFSDAERARVGTTYKQVDPREAMLEGLEIVGPKMRWLVEEATSLSKATFGLKDKSRIGVYCWRGGSRSSAVTWLLETTGFEVFRLEGGYKAYRQYARDYLNDLPFKFNSVDGSTGSGKTVLLQELAKRGAQVLDLEAIANHKGSAFGLAPGDEQPSTEHAENEIFAQLSGFDPDKEVWLENESRNIGKVFLPDGIIEAIGNAHRVVIVVPEADRIAHIVGQYGEYRSTVLADTFHHLRKRLGGQATQEAISAIDAGDLDTAARIALRYYDKAYAHYSARQGHPSSERHEVRFQDLTSLAAKLHP